MEGARVEHRQTAKQNPTIHISIKCFDMELNSIIFMTFKIGEQANSPQIQDGMMFTFFHSTSTELF